MVQYVITPWRNRSELLTVRQELYPSLSNSVDNSNPRHAVDKISVWMQRGNCPHLVESTAILTSAKLNDVPGNSNYCIRAAYAAAFSRFVTGLLDGHQDKRRKLSMFSIAKTIGLPATFVELRHQATHEELPSLRKLRNATEKALKWIWDYYWSQLSEDHSNAPDCKTFLEDRLKDKKEHTDGDLEAWLAEWGEGQIRVALDDISRTTTDTEVLLESSRLSRMLLMRDVELSIDNSIQEAEVRDLTEVKAELARVEENILDSGDVEARTRELSSTSEESTEAKGWALWEGPWIPTPIGTIC